MKRILFPAAVAAALIVTACTGNGRDSVDVSNFVVDETIKTASQAYHFADSALENQGYASITASIVWPEKLGDNSLRPLQDSILAHAFGMKPMGQSVDSAIKRFVTSTTLFDFDDVKWQRIDSVPEADDPNGALYYEVTAKIADLNERTVTYRVTTNSYTGGAHPSTASDVFTYALESATVLTPANMFVPGSEPKILEIIKQNLANQLNTSVERLDSAGIFTDQLTFPGDPYIADGMVVFHYNPYDIGPWAMGEINVNVWPGELDGLLTPLVLSLLD